MIEEMSVQNKSIEEIARAVSQKRNELRLDAYIGDPEGLARVKKSNLDTYGNENGPTIDYLYEKYGSWEAVLQKALSSNPGMDACLGLYDDFYSFYSIEEKVTLRAQEDAVSTDAATGIKTYKVVEGDNLWKISQKVYGDGTKWETIYKNNQDQLSDPSELKVGMSLVIPEIKAEDEKTGTAEAGKK
jgi:nucleoid-associated protein YgaU